MKKIIWFDELSGWILMGLSGIPFAALFIMNNIQFNWLNFICYVSGLVLFGTGSKLTGRR
jgi:hypothetical protein